MISPRQGKQFLSSIELTTGSKQNANYNNGFIPSHHPSQVRRCSIILLSVKIQRIDSIIWHFSWHLLKSLGFTSVWEIKAEQKYPFPINYYPNYAEIDFVSLAHSWELIVLWIHRKSFPYFTTWGKRINLKTSNQCKWHYMCIPRLTTIPQYHWYWCCQWAICSSRSA